MRIIEKKDTRLFAHVTTSKKRRLLAGRWQLYVILLVSSFLALAPLGATNADFTSKSQVIGNSFKTGCWSAPSVPVLVSPIDGFVANYGSPFLSNPLFDWRDSVSTCGEGPVTYDFEIYLDQNLTSLLHSETNLTNSQFVYSDLTMDGTYYWRVRAHGQSGQVSAFSSPWKLTIGATTLDTPKMIGWNLQTASATAGEKPVDLVCGDTTNGGDVNLPLVSHHWSPISGAGVKYQQRVTYPSGAVGDFFYAGPSYTHFWYLGAYPGIQGLWVVKVRAFVDANSDGRYTLGELVSNWSNDCTLTLDKNATAIPAIVMNEINPSPSGSDNEAKPNGEWVELYNRSDSDVDVNGWVLYDDDNTHALPINVSNSDNNQNPFDSGETVVPAHGYLVVYQNSEGGFDLEDGGDTVRLYQGTIGSGAVLRDKYQYPATAEDKTIARIPDGANNWVDPVSTPGRKNVVHKADLTPSILGWQQDAHHLQVGVFDATNYQFAHLTVQYARNQDGEEVTEQFEKDMYIAKTAEYLRDLFMGTVSSGTEYPHYGIHDIKIKVQLTGAGIPDRELNITLNEWTEE